MAPAYRWSTITPEDVEAWAQLSNHLADVDGTEEYFSAQDLTEELDDGYTDPARDTFSVWDGDTMVAMGRVWVKLTLDREGLAGGILLGGVHADHRGRGLGTALMEKLEARAAERLDQLHPGAPSYFGVGGALAGSGTQTFHASRGYEVVRWFNLMGRPTGTVAEAQEALAAVSLPPGVTLRAPTSEDEERVFAAHGAAFADHWGSAPPDRGLWAADWRLSSNRHAVSSLAVDADDQVLAYSLCGQWVDRELYVNLLGTVPAGRGQGLGSAVLLHTMLAAARSGEYDVVDLDVDSESLTGATRLYERLGFTLKHTQSAMRRPRG